MNDGHRPYVTTENEFSDIEFLLQYKTVPGADSGIYLRGTPQVQIWDAGQVFDPKNQPAPFIWDQVVCSTTWRELQAGTRLNWPTGRLASGIIFAYAKLENGRGFG